MPAAEAATSTEATFVLSDGAVHRRTGAISTTIVAGSSAGYATSVSSSADGTRLALREGRSVASTPEAIGGEAISIVVRDVSGRKVGTYGGAFLDYGDPNFDVGDPIISPDGNTVVFDTYFLADGDSYTSVADVGTGREYGLGVDGRGVFGFASGRIMLVYTATGLKSVRLGTDQTRPVVNGALYSGASRFAVSPALDRIAFEKAGQIYVASISVSGDDTVMLGVPAPVTSDTSGFNRGPTFTRDGSTIRYVHWYSSDPRVPADLASVPAAGGTPTVAQTPQDERGVAVGALDDTGPGATTSAPATLFGTAATVRWMLPDDPDLSGVILTRKLGSSVQEKVYVPAPQTSYLDRGLVLGSTYTYVVQPIDRSGNGGPGAVRDVGALLALPTASDPITNESTDTGFDLRLTPAATPGARFTIDFQVVPDPVRHRLATDREGGTYHVSRYYYGSDPALPASQAGRTLLFHVVGTDGHGNSTPSTSSDRIAVPLDERSLSFCAACGEGRRPDRYFGSIRTLYAAGHKASWSAAGDRVQVIGERLPDGGRFALYGKTGSGSWVKLGATVDTYASTRKARQVLLTYWFSRSLTRSYEIRWVPGPTSSRRVVAIDAVGIRR